MNQYEALAAQYQQVYGSQAFQTAVKDFKEGSLTWKEVLNLLSTCGCGVCKIADRLILQSDLSETCLNWRGELEDAPLLVLRVKEFQALAQLEGLFCPRYDLYRLTSRMFHVLRTDTYRSVTDLPRCVGHVRKWIRRLDG